MFLLVSGFIFNLISQFYLDYTQGFETFPDISVENATDAQLSYDDMFLYVVSENDNSLKVFSYDKSTGYIQFVERIENADIGNKFDFVHSIAIHPSDDWLYTVNQSDKTILKFDRQPNGSLSIDNAADTVLPLGAIGQNLIISTDGMDLYTGTRINGSLFHYKIDQITGMLTLHKTFSNGDMSGGNTISTLLGVNDFWLSNDEDYLYITTFNGDSVLVFSRAFDGELTFLQKVENNFGGISGMQQSLDISGYDTLDESFVVVNTTGSKMFAFSRNPITGVLTYLGDYNESSGKIISSEMNDKIYFCSASVNSATIKTLQLSSSLPEPIEEVDSDGIAGVTGCGGLELSIDESHLLRMAKTSKKVISYNVNPINGTLDLQLLYPPSQVENMVHVTSITSANDSPHVYVTSNQSNSISTFFRQPNGELTPMDSFVYVDDGISGIDGLTFVFDLAISNDGDHVYTAGYLDSGVGHFTRNSNPGSALHGLLTYQDIYKNGIDGISGLGGIYSLKFSNDVDQHYLYSTSLGDDTISVFERNVDGSLIQIQTITNATHSGILADPPEIHLNLDNTRAYVVSFLGNSVFEYDVINGQLDYNKTLDDGYFGIADNTFGFPTSMAVINNPAELNHNSFYVFSSTTDKITFIQRNDSTGDYSIGPTFSHPILEGICALLLNSTQDYLHVSCRNSDMIKTLKVNSDYSLTAVDIHQQLQSSMLGLDQPGLMKYSYDNEFLYSPGFLSNGFSVFKAVDDFIFASTFDK